MAKKNTQQLNRQSNNIETGISGFLSKSTILDFMKNHKNSRCFMISATQTDENIDIIDEMANDNKNHIKFITSKDAIANKLILPVDWQIALEQKDKLSSIYSVVKHIQQKNKTEKFNRCVLVSVSSQKELKDLSAKFIKDGIDTFTTCCSNNREYGMQRHNGKEIKGGIDEFKSEIKSSNNFKVVIHIKQLICGIDVDCFTDCIIHDMKSNNDNNQRTVIQTIGRCLRFWSNEERINAEKGNEKKNLKKTGSVWFIVKHEDDCNEIAAFMAAQYYCNNGTFFRCLTSNNSGTKQPVEIGNNGKVKIELVNLSWKAFKQNMAKKFEEFVNVGCGEMMVESFINEIKSNVTTKICYDDHIANKQKMNRLNEIMCMIGTKRVSELEKFLSK